MANCGPGGVGVYVCACARVCAGVSNGRFLWCAWSPPPRWPSGHGKEKSRQPAPRHIGFGGYGSHAPYTCTVHCSQQLTWKCRIHMLQPSWKWCGSNQTTGLKFSNPIQTGTEMNMSQRVGPLPAVWVRSLQSHVLSLLDFNARQDSMTFCISLCWYRLIDVLCCLCTYT
jgi:hypothetical protein